MELLRLASALELEDMGRVVWHRGQGKLESGLS
jgi:hypothetical protein